MDIFDNIALGLETAVSPTNLLFVFIGILLGMVIGVIPGLGPTATVALLLPFTTGVDASSAIIMLAGVYYGSMYGGTITSVMLRVPGEATSVITTIDGYPMAQQGRAASALGISAVGSLIGGIVAVLGMVILAPQMAALALDLGAASLASVGVLGLVLVSYIGTKSTAKSMGMACIGLLIATVGLDPLTGSVRSNFGLLGLRSGVDIVVLTVGLLGIPELISRLADRVGARGLDKTASTVGLTTLPTRRDLKESAGSIGRGSLIGFFLGLVPGGGGMMSSLASYAVERRVAKDPSRFGKGAIQGVAGPETANNAGSQSAFIPLLTLGIPPNAVLAVVFGALLLQGITPGPGLITEHPDVFWGVIVSMLVGNTMLVLVNVYLIRFWVGVIKVPVHYLAPTAFAVIIVSCYTISYSFFELSLVIFFGVLGYLMQRLGLEPAPLVLGFVLGAVIEVNFRRTLVLGGGSMSEFLGDPVSMIVIVLIAVLFITKGITLLRSRRRRSERDDERVEQRESV